MAVEVLRNVCETWLTVLRLGLGVRACGCMCIFHFSGTRRVQLVVQLLKFRGARQDTSYFGVWDAPAPGPGVQSSPL